MTKDEIKEYYKLVSEINSHSDVLDVLRNAIELIEKQEEMLIMYKKTLRMIRRSQNDVTSHLIGEKHV